MVQTPDPTSHSRGLVAFRFESVRTKQCVAFHMSMRGNNNKTMEKNIKKCLFNCLSQGCDRPPSCKYKSHADGTVKWRGSMWCPEMGGLHGMSDTTGNEMKSIPEAISFLLSFFLHPEKKCFLSSTQPESKWYPRDLQSCAPRLSYGRCRNTEVSALGS